LNLKEKARDSYNKSFLKEFIDMFIQFRIPDTAAAETYYLTFTFFPLIICLYTMLGKRYDSLIRLLDNFKELFTEETYNILSEFLKYINGNLSGTMFTAALVFLIIMASATFRSIHVRIGKMQGQIRFRGILGVAISVVLSLVFLVAIYAAIIMIVTGRWFMALIDSWLPWGEFSEWWSWLRIVILVAVIFLFVYFIYRLSRPRQDKYPIMLGTILATGMLITISLLLSSYVSYISKYPLVYGSIGALVVLMFWLYLCAFSLLVGAEINIVRRNRKRRVMMAEQEEEDFYNSFVNYEREKSEEEKEMEEPFYEE